MDKRTDLHGGLSRIFLNGFFLSTKFFSSFNDFKTLGLHGSVSRKRPGIGSVFTEFGSQKESERSIGHVLFELSI
jgi:hypothetical protein